MKRSASRSQRPPFYFCLQLLSSLLQYFETIGLNGFIDLRLGLVLMDQRYSFLGMEVKEQLRIFIEREMAKRTDGSAPPELEEMNQTRP